MGLGSDRGDAAGRACRAGRGRPASSTRTQRPATTAATGATLAPAIRTAPGNTRGYAVPDVLGRTLAQAERVMRTGGLHGSAYERDLQGRNGVVVAQEPPAGVLVPPGSVVGFRTRTDVQPYGVPRQLRLGRGPTTAAYRIVAPDPATHQLTVAVVAPLAADVEVWLETRPSSRLTPV
jgi:PASTA domain